MLNFRTYGLKISYNTTAEGHVEWVGNQVFYKKVQFSMLNFGGMMHQLTANPAIAV